MQRYSGAYHRRQPGARRTRRAAALKDRGLRLVVRTPTAACATCSIVSVTKWFDHVLDSHEWGVEKPDPRLFQLALEQSRAEAATTVHVGDLYHVDVAGSHTAKYLRRVLEPGSRLSRAAS
jgi:phosphoglycolate phosphatase-like HAD superfamily hydrolase